MVDYTLDALTLNGSFREEINVRTCRSDDKDTLIFMISSLYNEDSSIASMNATKIGKTINVLMNDPNKGAIIILEHKFRIIGYAIIINYWSNEFGGNISFIDELFILPEYRRKGIASAFIVQLFKKRINNSVAFQLEVTPKNSSALRLYKRLGFKPVQNSYYRYIFEIS